MRARYTQEQRMLDTYLNFSSRSLLTTSHETQMVVRQIRQTRDHLASRLVASYLRQATLMQTEMRVRRRSQL